MVLLSVIIYKLEQIRKVEGIFLKSASYIVTDIVLSLVIIIALAPPAFTTDPSFITQFHFKASSPIVIKALKAS